jgi:dienelactone hydrolase
MAGIRKPVAEYRHDELAMDPLGWFREAYDAAPRSFAMPTGDDPQTWTVWRRRFRRRLKDLLGVGRADRNPPESTVSDRVVRDGYSRSRLTFASSPGVLVPTWLLIPERHVGRSPAVIAVHGHGYGVNDIVGLQPDDSDRVGDPGYEKDFALDLVRRGFVVAAPEMSGFGRRREPEAIARGPEAWSCRVLQTWALMLGTTLIGRRLVDLIRTLDMLARRPEVDPNRIGILGLSGGATASMYLAALDDRVTATVLSGYVSTFLDSILAVEHCSCNIVPGLAADAEPADVAALIAPRSLLLESGQEDPIFPIGAAVRAASAVRSAYVALGKEDRFEFDVFDGGHEFSGRRAFDFLATALAARAGGHEPKG